MYEVPAVDVVGKSLGKEVSEGGCSVSGAACHGYTCMGGWGVCWVPSDSDVKLS